MEHAQKKKTSKPYSPEFRERAVWLAMEHRDEYQSEAAALIAIAGKLGCSPDSLRVWVRQAQRDGGERPGQTTAEKARIKELGAKKVITTQPDTSQPCPDDIGVFRRKSAFGEPTVHG